MSFIKKFDDFINEDASPEIKPGRPDVKPGVRPGKSPSKPSPIRRDKPAVSPAPKAKKEATAEDVVKRYLKITGGNE